VLLVERVKPIDVFVITGVGHARHELTQCGYPQRSTNFTRKQKAS
jgi:hypothetical protein